MRVLVTGGTGVVGTSAVTALLQRGHSVRLLSRHASEDVEQWSQGVHPWPGDVASAASLAGASDDCDAVLHLAAIIEEDPPASTFARVNVEGTRNILREAERAGVARFVYVSSLGAERGSSGYQRSKKEGEALVRAFGGDWRIVRPGAVYGPGDEHFSVLLRMVRTLPVVPVVGDGEQRFQPIWHEDLAEALAVVVERDDLARRSLAVAGRELTSQNDLLDRMRRLTDRSPARIPVPELAASLGLGALDLLGVGTPINEEQLTMLREGIVIPDDARNALVDDLGIEPTPLDRGLRMLVDVQPESLPSEGIGALHRKSFWADISGATLDADGLFALVRERFGVLMPRLVESEAERDTVRPIAEGETLTLGLPLRGHVQVRVAEVTERSFTLVTVEGHPLAGAVRFLVEERGDAVRFEIQTYSRDANVVDLLMMRALGDRLQDANWLQLVRNVVEASGGKSEAPRREGQSLDDEQARRVEEWLRGLVMARRRDDAGV